MSWSHFVLLIGLKDELQREFYTELCRLEHWSVRQLQERIQSMLFERSAISRKPEQTVQADLQALHQSGRPSTDLLLHRQAWRSSWMETGSVYQCVPYDAGLTVMPRTW